MDRLGKTEFVDSLHRTFSESESVILLSFERVNVPDITELRQKIGEASSGYQVVKNTLAMRAAEGTAVGNLKEFFIGPTAIAYTGDNPVGLAKVLKEAAKANKGLILKCGVLGEKVLTAEEVNTLAELPSRDELLSKLLFLLNAPLTKLATALKSPVCNLAVVLKQLEQKK